MYFYQINDKIARTDGAVRKDAGNEAEMALLDIFNSILATLQVFNLPVDQVQLHLESIVDSTVKEFLDIWEKVPTQDCLQWICNENESMRDGLEVWSYFAERGSVVDSWEGCYVDEVEELMGSNYSVHQAGG